ncbi:hypothetical protein [Bacillus toyonensis]|uniref:hypothetical protein n=1 Tax=Bacillus toyonensis TaxID=155322 RepID=UPI000BED8513|nr:hypothetical protein [Bacillus toyonensis]PDZ86119.1 hypothetical protein CON93_07140 [Bacillus toyonensis]PEA71047.1 hypothetical protein COO00_18835 [Bacillus toyonensis]
MKKSKAKIKEDRMKHDFKISKIIKDELNLLDEYFSKAVDLYPISHSDDLDFRVRLHKSLDYSKDPNLLEILVLLLQILSFTQSRFVMNWKT